MECMGAKALKSSFSTETNMKSVNSQGIIDDIWCVTGDDFLIDDFFNLPNDEITLKNNDEGKLFLEEEEEDEKCCNSSGSNGTVDDSARFSADFAVPDDDMQELELWSHLMDDSDPILTYPKPSMDANNKKTGFTKVNLVEPFRNPSIVTASFFPTAVPVKPRSKRSRSIGNRSWYTSSPPITESSSSSSSPVSTLLFPPPVHDMGMLYTHVKPPMKKPKKKTASSSNGETGLRRCSHCQVTKTPQWRAGPNGPKSLCNACGVRFKSGRLFPEYRPACSPTFSSEVHSNSHRKVLDMRRRKEIAEPPSTDSAHLVLNG